MRPLFLPRWVASCLITACLGTVAAADSAPAPLLAYQGRLVESGVVVTANRVVTFAIRGGDAELWNSGNQTLTVTNGLYSAVLGGVGMPAIPPSLLTTAGLTLRVTVGGHALTPDVAIVPAMQARSAWEAVNVTGTVAIANGGTGATDAATARSNLGLGSAAVADTSDFAAAAHDHSAADITAGTVAVARLPVLAGDAGSGGTAGIAPAPASGDAAAGKVLGAGGSWTNPLLPWIVIGGTSQTTVGDHGYIASNAALTTCTAPAAPSAGQVLAIVGVGAGGWTLTLNAGQTILLGESTPVAPILAGATWTARDSARAWRGITSSADGTKLAAVAQNDYIYTSADSGVTWTSRENSRPWTGITSSADGTTLAAVVSGGQIYTSTNSGVSWTAQASGNQAWSGIASSADGIKLVAITGNSVISTSTDSGVTWTPQASGTRQWSGIASSADGTTLAAVVFGGQIYVSTDSGITWTPHDSNRQWMGIAASADGATQAAVASGGNVYVSSDRGDTWTAHGNIDTWVSIAISDDGHAMVAGTATDVATSSDSGATWVALHHGANQIIGVASSANGTALAAVEESGYVYTSTGARPAITSMSGTAYTLVGGPGSCIELLWVSATTAVVRQKTGVVVH